MMIKYNNCRQGENAPMLSTGATYNKKKRRWEDTWEHYPIDQTPEGRAPFTCAHEFKTACTDTKRPMDPYFLLSLYEDQDKPTALASGVRRDKVEGGGSHTHKDYRDIIWQDTCILKHHLPASEAYGCKVKSILETITQPPPTSH
jgi:hypothetical protein